MKFSALLTHFRERAGLRKIDIANALAVGGTYITLVETDRCNPPTIDRLQKIREILKLEDLEYIQLLEAAYDGRISEEDKKILNELDYFKKKFNNGKTLKF